MTSNPATAQGTPPEKASRQFGKTPAEAGDIVGPNDGPATTHENQPIDTDAANRDALGRTGGKEGGAQ